MSNLQKPTTSLPNLLFEIDHRDLVLDTNIKKSGVYEVEVKLFREVRGVFKLFVVSEDSEEAPVQAAE